ncbi:MAG: holo-[acyl-carrier-protein] synthase [Candidatus Margulisbacteria bacterium GWF2_35_9]|nr:MAG: holo-[acyl-carrier-protein] synthase [Candidatus Margulisbacteria bacterium GWF2_35_9]
MIGIDIIEIDRIQTVISSQAFINRVFTKQEIIDCQSSPTIRVQASRFASRFAAKEAVFKAVAQIDILRWKDIQVTNELSGKPVITFFGETKKIMDKNKICVEVSLSHSRDNAVAMAIIK